MTVWFLSKQLLMHFGNILKARKYFRELDTIEMQKLQISVKVKIRVSQPEFPYFNGILTQVTF